MENGVEEQKNLQQLFDVLDGRLPSMTKYERKDYYASCHRFAFTWHKGTP